MTDIKFDGHRIRYVLYAEGYVNEEGQIERENTRRYTSWDPIESVPEGYFAVTEEWDGQEYITIEGSEILSNVPRKHYTGLFEFHKNEAHTEAMVMAQHFGSFDDEDFKGSFSIAGTTFLVDVKGKGQYQLHLGNILSGVRQAIYDNQTNKFPNGIESWIETHHEVVELLTLETVKEELSGLVFKTRQAGGYTAVYELAKSLTNEFENLHKGRFWDGDFVEEVEKFMKEKMSKE